MARAKPKAGEIRPGGRTREVRNAVAASVLELIKSGNIQFSYSELAEASGVHKTTLYRRWPQRMDLIREAIEVHNQDFILKAGTCWHDNAEAIVRSLAEFLSEPTEIAINRALLADPLSAESLVSVEYWRPIQASLKSLVTQAQSSGELPADIDPDTLILTLVAPLLVNTTLDLGPKNREDLILMLTRLARSYATQAD